MHLSKDAQVIYSFGDATGSGFGATFSINENIFYSSISQWNSNFSSESSNFRELVNLVFFIEEAQEKGPFGVQNFLFSLIIALQNQLSSKGPHLRIMLDLILRLQKLQLHKHMMINFIHVSGKRMIAQRTDGFLREITPMGAMAGSSFMEYVPLHLNALERQSQPLVEWTEDWFGSIGPFRWLSLEDWFHQGHFEERCIWFPAPATADAALEQRSHTSIRTTCT